jgi:hypothetical protein
MEFGLPTEVEVGVGAIVGLPNFLGIACFLLEPYRAQLTVDPWSHFAELIEQQLALSIAF